MLSPYARVLPVVSWDERTEWESATVGLDHGKKSVSEEICIAEAAIQPMKSWLARSDRSPGFPAGSSERELLL